jgi:hypothetical protein
MVGVDRVGAADGRFSKRQPFKLNADDLTDMVDPPSGLVFGEFKAPHWGHLVPTLAGPRHRWQSLTMSP